MGAKARNEAAAHRNLVESSRQLFEFDSGAQLEVRSGWLFGAGTSSHPTISNVAFRLDGGVDPHELLQGAHEFFGRRRRGFAVWVRAGGSHGDDDLLAAAEEAGLRPAYEMPEMLLDRRVEEVPAPGDCELRRVETPEQAAEYWKVAGQAYSSLGFPAEAFAFYDDHSGFCADNVFALLAYLDQQPVGIAMTIVSDGVAGIYWVGTLEQARGRGIARALTAATVNAGLDLGARVASLQASPMGEPIYRAMGFESVFTYRLLRADSPQ